MAVDENIVDVTEAMTLAERAWSSWKRRRLFYFALPAALLIPGAIFAIIRDPIPGESDWMGIAMLVCFGLGFAAILWARWQMPISPPRVRTLGDNGMLTSRHVERLRRQAAK